MIIKMGEKMRKLNYEEFEKQRKIISPNSFKPYKSRLINGMKILCETKEYESFINEVEILKDFLQKKDLNNKYLKEVFDDKSSNDLSLYTSLPSAFRKYKNYVLEGLIINQKRDLFIEIAKYHDLEYQKTNATYFQIYPKNIMKEGSGGTHYEFISENSILFLEVHIESKATIDFANFREAMKVFVEKSKYDFNTKMRPIKIDISKYSDDEIRDKFNEVYSEFQPFIEVNYKRKESDINEKGETKMENENEIKQPLNQILYGPPGTGKTYNTINKALEIVDNEFYTKNIGDRKLLTEKFEEYKKNGQIEFITFHQSYGYEEFVEGIKAIPVGKEGNETQEMIYDVVDGVFKKLSKRAKVIKSQSALQNFNWDRDNIFKMSLGGKYDENILDWCLENGYISMEWGSNIDFSGVIKDNWEEFRDESKILIQDKIEDDYIRFTTQAMYAFRKSMKINDLVFISVGNLKIVAIGQIIGDYEFKDDIEEIPYMQYRKVKWLFIDREGLSPEMLLNKKISQQTIYNLNKKYVKKEFFNTLFRNKLSKIKPHVLIIDEINRGNISKIFGELITLIEDSKRLGGEEELEITLPYSGDKFSVPNNLYILGTMNTADRSIALMDTALRRRFDFEEMMPKAELLEVIESNGIKIDLQKVLEIINQRIEYLYDRNHMIGHAYFIGIKTKKELDDVMRNKIIPLLQEYFYDDWEKIQIVLGDHEKQKYENPLDNEDRFIIAEKLKDVDILGFNYDDIEEDIISYKINPKFTETAYMIYEEE